MRCHFQDTGIGHNDRPVLSKLLYDCDKGRGKILREDLALVERKMMINKLGFTISIPSYIISVKY